MSSTGIISKSLGDKILRAILIVLILAAIATPLIGTMYTFLSEDDFSYESGGALGAAEYQSAIVGSFYKTLNIYKEQQGCYTPMYLDHLVIPYTRFGLPGFHMAMFTYVGLFLASLFALSFLLVKDKTASLGAALVAMMSVYTMSYTKLDTKIMYWYTETLGFTLLMAFLLFGIFFGILAVRSSGAKTTVFIVISSILAFLASGASLTVVAVNCAMHLAILILDYEKLKERKFLIIPFLFGFAGALLNAVAPGNFVRADTSLTPGHETVLDGIRDTFVCYFKLLPKALDIVFILAAITLIAILILYKVEIFKGGISGIKMIIVLGGVILLQLAELFPAAYGLHTSNITAHLTIEHIITTRITFIFVVLCFAQWLREKFFKEEKEAVNMILKVVCGAAAVLLLILPASRGIISDSFSARSFRDFKNGNFVRVYRIREYELSFFDMAEEGTDAIIYIPWDTSSETLPAMGIGADSEWFVNISAAHMYNLHTTTALTP